MKNVVEKGSKEVFILLKTNTFGNESAFSFCPTGISTSFLIPESWSDNPPSTFIARIRIPYGSLVPIASLPLEPQVVLAPCVPRITFLPRRQ